MSSASARRGIPWGAASLAGILVAAAIALAVVAFRGSAPSGNLQDRVRSVASTLRCPVCQNLSVADSPSRLATQMRATIGQELQSGRTASQIRQEFATAYGEWILLAPPKHGIDMAVWLAPLILLVGGLGISVVAVRRWTAGSSPEASPGAVEEPAMSEADRRLLDRALASVPEDAG
jgi:cytochrome c-type biogenesis protein CcmH